MADLEAAMPMQAAEPAPPAAPPEFIVFFGFDRSDVGNAGMRTLDRAVEAAQQFGAEGFSVTGYTDSAGSEQYNLNLSLRRAEAVRDALVARGVDAGTISLAGRGEADQAVATDDGVREAANRRVVILLQ